MAPNLIRRLKCYLRAELECRVFGEVWLLIWWMGGGSGPPDNLIFILFRVFADFQRDPEVFSAKWFFGGLVYQGQKTTHVLETSVFVGLAAFGSKAKTP